jgi:hypothetical protein
MFQGMIAIEPLHLERIKAECPPLLTEPKETASRLRLQSSRSALKLLCAALILGLVGRVTGGNPLAGTVEQIVQTTG